MDRCALFVDANYALAEGALVVHGTRNRDSVSWDYAGLLKLLGSLSRDRTGLPLLRCYWYDTAADGARAAEHETLADIPAVKLRLSKARPSRKEGVEAEIRKDLTALARNRAVSDVIVVSAEEDLAPVIAEVQDLGIRTVLFHIATDGGWAIARTLRQECDDIIEIGGGAPAALRGPHLRGRAAAADRGLPGAGRRLGPGERPPPRHRGPPGQVVRITADQRIRARRARRRRSGPRSSTGRASIRWACRDAALWSHPGHRRQPARASEAPRTRRDRGPRKLSQWRTRRPLRRP